MQADPVTIQLTPEELETIINRAVAKAGRAQPQAPAKWLTKGEAAAIAKISKRTVDARIAAGTYRITKGSSARSSPVRVLASDVALDLDRRMQVRTPGVPLYDRL